MDIIVPKTVKEWAAEYIAAGFSLCAITKGRKAPLEDGWEKPENYKNPDDFRPGQGIGLVHGPSNTCTIDLDDMVKAEPYFMTHGVDIQALLNAPDAVRISSGRENRAKLVYRVPEGTPRLKTYKIVGCGVELRCRADTSDGSQDVLPPTIHPDTGNPYVWLKEGSFNNLPNLPKEIIALWLSLGNKSIIRNSSKSDLDIPQELTIEDWFCINSALAVLSPDDYDLWFKVGIALYPYENGFDVWDEWSGKSIKYSSVKAIDKWFHLEPRENDPITYKSIFEWAFEYEGWINPAKGVSKASLSKQVAQLSRGEDIEVARAQTASVDELTDGEGLYFDERNPPTVDKKFYMGDWIPEGGVTLLSGDGGVGKSFSSLNMAVCIALGLDYGDLPTRKAKVYFVTAEDDKDDVNARITNICANLLDAFDKPVDKRALDGQLLVWDVTKAATTFLFDEQGITTALIKHADRARAYGARIMFFDNISNLYGADENKRSQVVGFIKGLTVEMIGKDDRTVDEIDVLAKKAVFLNGHTSKSNLGSIGAGSLAWQQAARFQLFIALKEIVVGKPMQPVLTAVKSNHSKLLSSVTLHWDRGAYVPLTQKGLEIQTTKRKNDAFQDLKTDVLNALVAAIRGETEVSASRSGITKTVLMLEKYGSFDKTIAEKERYKALDSLQKDGVILIETRSVKSNKREFYLLADGWDLV